MEAAAANNSDVADENAANMTSSSATEAMDDAQDISSTSKLASAAEVDDDADTQNSSSSVVQSSQQAPAVNDDGIGRMSSMSSVTSFLTRRSKSTATPTDPNPSVVTLLDVRKFVFQATARSDKRIMGGLTAHTFTSQTFISSFAVGLAVGSILAILIKLLTEISYRALPYRR